MSDLIDRKLLIRRLCSHCADNCEEECFDVRIINSMPSVDATPVDDYTITQAEAPMTETEK